METNRYYIYKGYDKRIIGIREYRHWYVPIREFEYIIYDGYIRSEIMNDIHNYGWNKRDDEYVLVFRQQYSPHILKNCTDEAQELELWENFEDFILKYTRSYAKSPVDMMHDFYLLDEIRTYKSNKEIGPLIQNLITLNKNDYSVDDIIEKELMRIEDKKNIISFINLQRNNLKQLISDKKYKQASDYIKKTHGSW
jgi:hypothetical protein